MPACFACDNCFENVDELVHHLFTQHSGLAVWDVVWRGGARRSDGSFNSSAIQSWEGRCICGWHRFVGEGEPYGYSLVIDHWKSEPLDHHLAKCRMALAAGLRADRSA